MGCFPSSSFFLFAIKFGPQLEGFILKQSAPLWPSYIGEKKTTIAKTYGIKLRSYENPSLPQNPKGKTLGPLKAC
jgi:hypothetical protein